MGNDEKPNPQKEIDNVPNLQKEEEEIVQTFLTLNDENELTKFTKENHKTLSKYIETITYSLFQTHNDISWMSFYKAHFQNLIQPNDMDNQLAVLFAIQKYCHSINFPKNGKENLIHTYFQQMIVDDIVSYDSFFEWKDDESKEHEIGKMKAIIQTMDWFNYLEEMMEVPDEEEEEYEEEYEDGY